MEIAKGRSNGKEPTLAERLKIRKADPTDTPDKLLKDFETRGVQALTQRGIVTEDRLLELIEGMGVATRSRSWSPLRLQRPTPELTLEMRGWLKFRGRCGRIGRRCASRQGGMIRPVER